MEYLHTCKNCETKFKSNFPKHFYCTKICRDKKYSINDRMVRKGLDGIDKLENEIWVVLLEDYYYVSNMGRFFSVIYDRLLKPHKHYSGYRNISLKKMYKTIQILHRIVAKTFIPNPENKKEVNHIDGDKSNNKVSNLEWCTSSENQIHAYKHYLRNDQKEINQFSLDDKFLASYKSLSEACRVNNFANSVVSRCCLGKSKTAYGFKWKYTEQSDKIN